MDQRKNDILICLLIGLSFLWTGCGYLSWFYHLTAFYEAAAVDMLTEVIGYLFQAAGLTAYALSMRKHPASDFGRHSFALLSITGFILDLLASLSPSGALSLIFGYGMNIVFGMIAGAYLTMLAKNTSPARTGIIFGAGYGIGSVLSYLLSLPGEGNFLAGPWVFIVYAVLIALSVLLYGRIDAGASAGERQETTGIRLYIPDKGPNAAGARSAIDGNPSKGSLSYLWLPCVTILLLSTVKSGGFYFPAADLEGYNVSLELSRSFYAAGLIAAGLINDRKRSAGAVLCVAALVFPFFTMIAGAHSGLNYALWIGGYIFFGFYAVYRVLLFVDISRSGQSLSWLACMGLMWGRLGDAAGAACGITLGEQPVVLITVMALLFVICIFMFFRLFQAIYMEQAAPVPDYVISFSLRYDLSQRETDLLRLIIDGSTNKEIAEKLYISENTVKFHIRNLLRKTECSNRKELRALFDSTRSSS